MTRAVGDEDGGNGGVAEIAMRGVTGLCEIKRETDGVSVGSSRDEVVSTAAMPLEKSCHGGGRL